MPRRNKRGRPNAITCLVTGAQGCGKTSLVQRYKDNAFSEEYIPTRMMGRHPKKVQIKGKDMVIILSDVDGAKQYEEHSINYYAENDVIMILYDVSDQSSLPSFKSLCETTGRYAMNEPDIVIVGCKTDRERNINQEDIQSIAEELDASYFESSAKTGENVNEMFTYLIEKYLEKNHQKNLENGQDDNNVKTEERTRLTRNTSNVSYLVPVQETSKENSNCSCTIS